MIIIIVRGLGDRGRCIQAATQRRDDDDDDAARPAGATPRVIFDLAPEAVVAIVNVLLGATVELDSRVVFILPPRT